MNFPCAKSVICHYCERRYFHVYKFSRIYEKVFSIIGSSGYYTSNFRGVYIFADILETRIMRKYVQRENIYVHSICYAALTWQTHSEIAHGRYHNTTNVYNHGIYILRIQNSQCFPLKFMIDLVNLQKGLCTLVVALAALDRALAHLFMSSSDSA